MLKLRAAALKSESRAPRILHLGSFRELGLCQDTLPCSFPSPLGPSHQQINMCRYVHVVAAVQSLSYVQLFETLRTTACQASLSFTISWSLLKLMSTELMMPSNYLIPCNPLLLPTIFPSIRVFSNESALCSRWPKYWSFSFNISPSNERLPSHPCIIIVVPLTYICAVLCCA